MAKPFPSVWIIICLSLIPSFCEPQVNIIGIPHSDRAVDLAIRDSNGKEVDPRKPFGPLIVGATLVLYCETRHPAISHLAWSRDGIEFFGSVARFSDGLLQNELRVTLSPADKSALYKCRGLNLRYDAIVEKSLQLDVTDQIQVPLSATILPANETFKANETVNLRCLVQGSQGPAIITWWKGDHLINETTGSAAPGITIRDGITNTESSFTFKAAVIDNGLTIFCRAISALSQLSDNITAEAAIKLDVIYLPATHIAKNETIFSKENGPINIPCSLKSNPPVDKVRWYRNDKLIFEDRLKNPTATPQAADETAANTIPNTAVKPDVQTNALRILQVSRNDIGAYTCEGHNVVGWGPRSNSVEVKVQYKPGPAKTAKQQASTEIHAAEGEKLTLTCTVVDPGNPPSFTFIWRKDGAFLARGHTYTLNPVQERNFGSYTCAPYNGAGEGDSASIILTRKEEALAQNSETTVLMVASILGVVGGTILLAIVIWCLCLSKSCRNRNKTNHLTSKFMASAYPAHTLPRPHLITNTQQSSTLSRENPPSRPGLQIKQTSPTSGSFMFGNSYSNHNGNSSRPNYYPSWYSQRTEQSNSYFGRNYKY